MKKINTGKHCIMMKSVFYSFKPHQRKKNLKLCAEVKNFINDQEKLGNTVILPKINDAIIAVQIGTSNLIKIYSIKLKLFIRQFLFTKQEVHFD